MAEKVTANYAPETCLSCGGTGRNRNRVTETCFACSGKGSVLVAQPSRRCPQCSNGWNYNAGIACGICRGTGWSHVADSV